MNTKVCTVCGTEKKTSYFYPKKTGKFKVSAACKECDLLAHKKYYKDNRDMVLSKVRERSRGSKKEKAVYDRNYNVVNNTRLLRQKENTRLKRSYKITLEQYFDMLFKQSFRCLGCGKHQSDIEWALCIDHDHKCCSGERSCGKCIRGLLCIHCNHAIGSAYDDVGTLKNLVLYLESFEQQGKPA